MASDSNPPLNISPSPAIRARISLDFLASNSKDNTTHHNPFLYVAMKYSLTLFFIFYTGCGFTQPVNNKTNMDREAVILLHGLARTSTSMNKMQEALKDNGFKTCNINYPSTQHRISVLAQEHILPKIKACAGNIDSSIHFVTHSIGGILVRYFAKHALIPHIGRVIMLSPPNQGSEVVDVLGDTWFFEFINGPAGKELGTDTGSMPLRLGPANFEVGIITGSRSINLILSLMIEGRDDGKVSVERAKLEGMKDFLVLPLAHPFIMRNEEAIAQTIYFLNHGVFKTNED